MNQELTSTRNHVFFLIVLTIGGFVIRYHCLGCLGFRGDEDITSLAVKALALGGIPELPSGMIYPRFYLYQLSISWSVLAFGFSEFSMRLPGVFFGTALIPVAYFVAYKLVDKKLALIVAIGIALSFWQVEMSRTARMYAPFYLIYLLAAFSIYQAHFINRDRRWSPVAIILCVIALSLHQLAYSLAIFFLLAIPLRPTPARSTALVLQSCLVAILFLVTRQIQGYFFYRGKSLGSSVDLDAVTDPVDGGIISAILEQFSLPDLSLLLQATGSSFWFPAIYVTIVTALLYWCWINSKNYTIWTRSLGILAILFSAAHQFNLAIIFLALTVIANNSGVATIKDAAWQKFAIACTALGVFWTGYIFVVSHYSVVDIDIADTGLRKMLRALVDYPNFRLFWSFVLERPLLAPALALGTLWCIDGVARSKPQPVALFLAGGFWTVLFANSVLDTKFEFFRYNLHLDVFYLALVVIGIVKLPDILRMLGMSDVMPRMQNATAPFLMAIAAGLVIISVRPDAAFLTSTRGYYETGIWYETTGLSRYPDFQSPGNYVRDRLEPIDRILVFDPREYWNYIGRVDYWIYSDNYQSQTFNVNGQDRDLYLGIPVVHTLAEVESIVAEAESADIWFLYSGTRLSKTPWVDEEIKAFMYNMADRIVFTGRDRDTVVIRLKPDDPLRIPHESTSIP